MSPSSGSLSTRLIRGYSTTRSTGSGILILIVFLYLPPKLWSFEDALLLIYLFSFYIWAAGRTFKFVLTQFSSGYTMWPSECRQTQLALGLKTHVPLCFSTSRRNSEVTRQQFRRAVAAARFPVPPVRVEPGHIRTARADCRKTCRSHGLSGGAARLVPRRVRPLPGRGHQGPVELFQGRTGLLCHHPQAPTRPHVSSSWWMGGRTDAGHLRLNWI